MSSNAVQIFGSSPALPSQSRRSPGRRQRNGIVSKQQSLRNKSRNGETANKKKKKKKKQRKTEGFSRALAEYGECGILYAKAHQDPFYFVNSDTKLPCVPFGPKCKTKRHALYTTGIMETGANGLGFITFNPYGIASNPTANSIENPIFATNQNFTSTTIAGSSTTGVSSYVFPTPYLVANNPAFRVVAAAIELVYQGPLLYTAGDTAFCQKPSMTTGWFGDSVEAPFSDPTAIIKPVSPKKMRYIWRFGNDTPTLIASEQHEFQTYSTLTGNATHSMVIAIQGATGAGSGVPFRFRAVSIIEVQSYHDGTRRLVPTDAINTDSSTHAYEGVNEKVNQNRGEGNVPLDNLIKEVQPHVEKAKEIYNEFKKTTETAKKFVPNG